MPDPGGVLDQDVYLLDAMRTCAAVASTARRKLKDYKDGDHQIMRIVDIIRALDGPNLERTLIRSCGSRIVTNGRLNVALAEQKGIGMLIPEIEGRLNANL